jgi:hypothetical protein
MPCLLTLIALVTPRLAIGILWLFTHWFRGVFDHAIWPLLGFFVLPTTVLWYSVVHNWMGGQWGVWAVVGLIVSLLIDLSPMRGRRRARE